MAVERERRRWVALAGTMLLGAVMVTPAPVQSTTCAEVLTTEHVDADCNRIFDDLDSEMQGQSSEWRRSVTVLLTQKPTSEKIQELKDAIGNFTITSNKTHPDDAEGKPWSIVPGFATNLTKEQILKLADRSDVHQIETDAEVRAEMDTAKEESGVNKARVDFNVDGDRTGAQKTYTKDDIVICVVDSGIEDAHVDLNEGQIIGFYDFVGPTPEPAPYDDNGHGTHVAGIAAGQGDGNAIYRGVAPGAALVGVKVLDATGGGTVQDGIDGIDKCVNKKAEHGIEIINISWGVNTCGDGTDTVSQAVRNAWVNHSLVVTKSAGNGGPGACTITNPGNAAEVITVGRMSDPKNAVCADDLTTKHPPGGWYLGNSSSRGPTADQRIKPDIVAPGTCIKAPDNLINDGYITLTGTSMAAPFVAGVVALMLDADPTLTPDQVKSKLHSTAQDWGPDNQAAEPQSYDYGAGRLQAHDAVESACNCGDFSGPANPAHFFREEDLAQQGAVDEYEANVNDATWTLSAALVFPRGFNWDFDLEVRRPDGTLIGEGKTRARQDLVSVDISAHGTGTYKIKVISAEGSGSYWLDLSAGATSLTLVSDG